MNAIYSRKISKKEANNDFIFILKSQLSFFPELWTLFELVNGDLSKKVKVESYPCTCRGPEKPHEHYFIRWESLKTGDEVRIIKNSDNKYILKIL